MEKPKILSEQKRKEYWIKARNLANQLDRDIEGHAKLEDITAIFDGAEMAMCEAQLDADVAHYEPLIQQAKAEVAREMIEEIKKVRSENPYSADEDTDEFFAFDLACAKITKNMDGK
jgi:hypothetical protein